ncbi:hypothetical protein [Streptomyces sp. NPDC086777]|uniref:hypothetical protein n=1 Tax=Streptomyces sp. NPDC086777 TaxID=3154866 RepID=UPI00344E7C3C
MPRHGRFRELEADIPDGRKALTEALRRLMLVIGLSLRKTHEALELRNSGCDASASALSDLLNARVSKPKESVVQALYGLAETIAREKRLPMPIGWEELKTLWREACKPPAPLCVECGSPVLPVPQPMGDRQHGQGRWPNVLALLAMKQNRRSEDIAGVLRHLGMTASPEEVAHAVTVCRARGLRSEAEVILRYVQSGRDGHELAQIAYEFIQVENNAMARRLLEMSLTR